MILRNLYRSRLISPKGIFALIYSIVGSGINLMAILRFSAKLHSHKTAITDDHEQLNYAELYLRATQLTYALHDDLHLSKKSQIAILARNNVYFVLAVSATSRLGADAYLLNTEMSYSQILFLHQQYDFECIIYEQEFHPIVAALPNQPILLPISGSLKPTVQEISKKKVQDHQRLSRTNSGKLILLTGGTSGACKTAEHQPSVFNFIAPLLAIISKLQLHRRQTVYVATPAYHGFGFAGILIALLLGKQLFLTTRFDAHRAVELIYHHQIEIITLVPSMLFLMMDSDVKHLSSLQCIVSGGAPLPATLIERVFNSLGRCLFNLYGTSEAGFSVIADPNDLRNSPQSIGRKIRGVRIKILDADDTELPFNQIGQLCIKSSWTIKQSANSWIKTGDLAYCNESGYYFLCGRIDDMIVSGGENVYPTDLESILSHHPSLSQVSVLGVNDKVFGQRLVAFVVLQSGAETNEIELLKWLNGRAARYQIPKQIIVIETLPLTPLGKVDKQLLIVNC